MTAMAEADEETSRTASSFSSTSLTQSSFFLHRTYQGWPELELLLSLNSFGMIMAVSTQLPPSWSIFGGAAQMVTW